MTKAYQDHLDSDYWKRVAKEVKARAGWRCQICDSPHDLQAHHRSYKNRGRELEHLDDLTCLCRRCHGVFHGVLESLKPIEQKTTRIEIVVPSHHMSKKQRKVAMRNATQLAKLANEPTPAIPPERIQEYDHGADMPKEFPFVIDRDFMRKLRTVRGGYTNATLRVLGLVAPLAHGWPRRVIGTVLNREQCLYALQGREKYNSGSLE